MLKRTLTYTSKKQVTLGSGSGEAINLNLGDQRLKELEGIPFEEMTNRQKILYWTWKKKQTNKERDNIVAEYNRLDDDFNLQKQKCS
jgi:hypothetical protein